MLNQPVSKNKKEFFKLVALNYGRFFNKKNLKKGHLEKMKFRGVLLLTLEISY